jgi:hypothetical protein
MYLSCPSQGALSESARLFKRIAKQLKMARSSVYRVLGDTT